MRATISLTLTCLLMSATTLTADDKPAEPVREIDVKEAKIEPMRDGKVAEPVKITSADELKKAVGDDAAKALEKAVDYKKEYLLLFRWSGSGQDKLTATGEKGDKGQVVTFAYSPGRTRDLRPHTHLFAVDAKAEWKMAK